MGEGQRLVGKQQITTYVADMAKIEEREFFLRKAAEKLRMDANLSEKDMASKAEKAERMRESASRDFACAIEELEKTENQLKERQAFLKKNEDTYAKNLKEMEPFVKAGHTTHQTIEWGVLFGIGAGTLIGCAVIAAICAVIFDISYSAIPLVANLVAILVAVIAGLKMKKDNDKINKDVDRYSLLKLQTESYEKEKRDEEMLLKKYGESKEKAEKCEEKLREAEENRELLLAQQEENKRKADFLRAQGEILTEQADLIKIRKKEIYAFGIVPPDYRTLDCVIILHSIFRNDLADTMRDAILLYEEKVFRGELLKGIENIYNMLGRLAQSMQAIESCLIGIRNGVNKMCFELSDISNQLYRVNSNIKSASALSQEAHKESMEIAYAQEENQRKLLQETQATRYAAEALAYSAQCADFYAEQRKKGLL